VGHVERMWILRNLKGIGHLEGLGVDEMITLKLILNIYYLRVWTGLSRLKVGSSGGLLCTLNFRVPHPASYPVGTRDSFPGGKAAGA
jgi:hypothetical protein